MSKLDLHKKALVSKKIEYLKIVEKRLFIRHKTLQSINERNRSKIKRKSGYFNSCRQKFPNPRKNEVKCHENANML